MANVLVVDDDPTVIEFVRDALRSAGHVVYHASDYDSMNQVLFMVPLAAIVLDVHLPKVNGDKLAAMVQLSFKPAPRIILHSGIEEAELRRLARQARAVNYLVKGCPLDQMLDVVGAAVRSYQDEVKAGGAAGPKPA